MKCVAHASVREQKTILYHHVKSFAADRYNNRTHIPPLYFVILRHNTKLFFFYTNFARTLWPTRYHQNASLRRLKFTTCWEDTMLKHVWFFFVFSLFLFCTELLWGFKDEWIRRTIWKKDIGMEIRVKCQSKTKREWENRSKSSGWVAQERRGLWNYTAGSLLGYWWFVWLLHDWLFLRWMLQLLR